MKKIIIKGGSKLRGSIKISGAKNAILPIMAASLLTKKEVILHNVPRLIDLENMSKLIRSIGSKITLIKNTMFIKANKLTGKALINNSIVSLIRSSLFLPTVLLHRTHSKRIIMPLPGGCSIGERKLDSYILGLNKLGAKTDIIKGNIRIRSNDIHGSHITLTYPSVSATENIMMAACLAKGFTTIYNVAKEPEVIELALFLNSMGAKINGAGTDVIKIEGIDTLNGTEYTIMPDRIETGTYMIAAAITNGDIILKNTNIRFLKAVVTKLRKMGLEIEEVKEGVHITSSNSLHPIDIITEVYPGFPTDMQPIITPLLSITKGQSMIKETIFNNRFNHIPELKKMGADIKICSNNIYIKGVKKLMGAKVTALDLRSGGGLIIAGLIAEGETIIDGVYQIFRGYDKPLKKLKNVGAKCTLIID